MAEESNNHFNMHLLIAYCVAGNIIGAGDKLISKMRMVPNIIQHTDNDKKFIRRWALASYERDNKYQNNFNNQNLPTKSRQTPST